MFCDRLCGRSLIEKEKPSSLVISLCRGLFRKEGSSSFYLEIFYITAL